jgi:tetratricopeptide (TPR) repeat protein
MPTITNVGACPKIPKVGLINADAWCETRSGTLSELEHWGIETVFSIAVTAAEHTPELADNIFVWPNCVDPDVYKDYQEHKLIPILLSGATAALYPWRQRVHELLAARYPSLSCPHPGYLARPAANSSMFGERYARTLNAAWVAPVCGTVAKELVRKHFEIPACKALMVTEKSPALVAAGFIDMQNCVFADEHEVLDKVAYLFEHTDALVKIACAGHDLVHSRHTMKQRDQLFQWYTLNQTLQVDQKIIQPGVFEPLKVVGGSSPAKSRHLISNGLHLSLLQRGDDMLLSGRYEEAEAAYSACLGYMRRLPEARLKAALCNLYQGDADVAALAIFELIQYALDEYKAPDPDPVEWAYYILALLSQGKLGEAGRRARQFPLLRHTELDRVRWAVQVLQDKVSDAPLTPCKDGVGTRPSIHRLPKREAEIWISEVCKMLVACHQPRFANKLATVSMNAAGRSPDTHRETGPSVKVSTCRKSEGDVSASAILSSSNERIGLGLFRYRLASYKVGRKIGTASRALVRRVRANYDCLLSVAGPRTQPSAFGCAIRDLIQKKELTTALLLLGREPQNDSLLAAVIGAMANKNYSLDVDIEESPKPKVYRLRSSSEGTHISLTRIDLSMSSIDGIPEENDDAESAETVCWLEHGVDLMLIYGAEARASLGGLLDAIHASRFVALGHSNGIGEREIYSYLLKSDDYEVFTKSRISDISYTIFRNKAVCNTRLRRVLPRSSTARRPEVDRKTAYEPDDSNANLSSAVLQVQTPCAESGADEGCGFVMKEKRS